LYIAARIVFFVLALAGAILTGLVWPRLVPVNEARPIPLLRLPESVLMTACAAGSLWLGGGATSLFAAGLPLGLAAYWAQRMAMRAFVLSINGRTIEPLWRERARTRIEGAESEP